MALPKLRFKEFGDEWIQSTFKDADIQIIDGDRGNNYPKSDDFFTDEYCLFLNAGNVTKDGFLFEKLQFITKEKDLLLRKGKLERNDLVITTRGTVGNVAFFDENIPFNQLRINSGMVIARCKKNALAVFINQFLKSYTFDKWLEKNVFGSAQPQLTVKLLQSINIAYSSKDEQTKVASFLSAVDEKISQLTQKHALLSQYKQGMMQKLFSQQIRFKADDGSEFGEWENLTIQNLVDNQILDKPMDGNHGEIHPTSNDYVEDGIPFIMATDVLNGKIDIKKSKKITKQQANKLRKGFSITGDVLLTHKATIGNVAIVPKLAVEYIMLTPQVTYYRVSDLEKLSNQFLKVYFESPNFQKSLLDLCTGATRLYIGISEQRKLPISLPCLEEQTKIANFLSAIDQKIEVVTQQIEQAKTWKKGLLQQMFV